MSVNTPNLLHYLIVPRTGYVVAQCLDFDIVATASDQNEAIRRLDVMVQAYVPQLIASGRWITEPSAPEDYWDRFRSGQPLPARSIEFESSGSELQLAQPPAQLGVLAYLDDDVP